MAIDTNVTQGQTLNGGGVGAQPSAIVEHNSLSLNSKFRFSTDASWVAFSGYWTSAPDSAVPGPGKILYLFGHGNKAPGDLEPLLRHTRNCMIVLEEYVAIFRFLWRYTSMLDTGLVITGNPGIGKTIALWYLLVRLVQKGETILFTIKTESRLFYQGNVYDIDSNFNLKSWDLPAGRIWSLIDMGNLNAEPHPTLTCNKVIPVQASPLNVSLNQKWAEQNWPEFRYLSDGYVLIRNILSAMQMQWKRKPSVCYILVSPPPADTTIVNRWQWKMPIPYDSNWEFHVHREEHFHLVLPDSSLAPR